jgi:ubiquinone/menaquinone biosynthesis C-methylase UbiE
MFNATHRFTTRVDNYIKYRPHYPDAIIDLLEREYGLTPAAVVADIGSGTGILAELFLRYGCRVSGVEPNDAMRAAGEQILSSYDRFTSVAATAEGTTLPDHSIDLITAGQAFHWFDAERTATEWRRILKPNGYVALIWNTRRTSGTPFLEAYEQMLRTFGTDYDVVNQQNPEHVPERRAFFGGDAFALHTFPNQQVFDWDGVRGRLLSSSYTPEPDHPNYEPMLAELRRIFDQHNENGTVTFVYATEVWIGQFA